jgi:hypothetical protein
MSHTTEMVAEYHRRFFERNPDRFEVKRIVKNALRQGVLIKQPCEVCGDPKTQGHHDDYSKPLSVRWLCQKHHWDIHRQERALQREQRRAQRAKAVA